MNWRRLISRAPGDRERIEEFEAHLRRQVDEYVERGFSLDEATRRARLQFGNPRVTREAIADLRQLASLGALWRDIRYAVRVLRRSPAFTLTAVATLALGIGANTALFGMLEALLIRSLPVAHPAQLVRLLDDDRETWSYPGFDLLRQRARDLTGVIATYDIPQAQIEERGTLRAASVQAASGDYFDVLGVQARRGRLFHSADATSSSDATAVISDAYWRRHYAAAPSAIGSRFRYAQRDFTIVGIAPTQFFGTTVDLPADVWVPLEQTMSANSLLWTKGRWLRVMARLPSRVSAVQAAGEAASLLGRRVVIESGANGFSMLRERFVRPLVILQIVAAIVLLIACANLANLMLTRTIARAHELALRRAIGASAACLVRQLLTESLLLSAAGELLAVVVAYRLNSALLRFLPPKNEGAVATLGLHLNFHLLAWSGALSLATCVLLGLAPALRAARATPGGVLGARAETGPTRRQRLLNRALLTGQVALCVFLLIGAGLFVRTLRNLWAQDTGFRARGLVVATVQRERRDYQETPWLQALDDVRQRVRALPGVGAAGFSHIGQLSGFGIEGNIYIHGQATAPGAARDGFEQRISPGFLGAMGTSLIAGRDFDGRDTASAPPVAIVNATFARQFLSTTEALGRRFGNYPESPGAFEIVGVVEDSKWISLREASRPIYYRPFAQTPASLATLVVATTGRTDSLVNALRDVTTTGGQRVLLQDVMPFTDVVNRTLVTERLLAQVSAGFGILALVIGAIGVYGVLAYSVARRTHEIGVRMALGATPAHVHWILLRESLLALLLGSASGVVAAMATGRFVTSILFGLAPTDPGTVVGALGLLTLVLLAAAYLPARRATRVDPLIALRSD